MDPIGGAALPSPRIGGAQSAVTAYGGISSSSGAGGGIGIGGIPPPDAPVVHTIDLTADRYYLSNALKAILHSIIFHRGFVATKPVEVTVDALDVTYVKVEDPEVSKLIDEKVLVFIKSLEAHSSSSTSTASSPIIGTPGAVGVVAAAAAAAGFGKAPAAAVHAISVLFLERRAKKSTYWFSVKSEEEVCWEQWTVRVSVTQARTEREQIEARRAVEANLLGCLLRLTQLANEQKDHVPPITNTDTYPFPFQIVFNSAPDASTWGGLIKGLMSNTGPSVLGL
ncbi:hypothetical protein DFJ73DRAFT_867997 [Zopfochytrium polystomum]|nr:hypothetical protein DFJ73DRAFT_867997 [Zopfochytrium polystomum]